MVEREVRVLLAGYGTVGRTLHRILEERAADLARDHHVRFRVVGIARRDRVAASETGFDFGSPNQLPWKSGTLFDLMGEVKGDVLVEATPTDLAKGQPGLGHARAALRENMPVVLANKGPLVVAYKELTERAEKAGVPLRFEATVAGCIPTFNAVRHAFAGNPVSRIEGILNGTTNFILTRMLEERREFEDALREAQSLGYAEANPTNDVDGLDAAAKIIILGNALLGLDLSMDKVETAGIRSVSRQAVEVAANRGFKVKLVAEVDRQGKARVGPRLVPRGSTLDVSGALNAVRFSTELAGPVTHIGPGAGGGPTAAAVLSDLLDVFHNGSRGGSGLRSLASTATKS